MKGPGDRSLIFGEMVPCGLAPPWPLTPRTLWFAAGLGELSTECESLVLAERHPKVFFFAFSGQCLL